MEHNYSEQVLAQVETTNKKKICKCCGKELPITAFRKHAGGYRSICMTCEREGSGISEKFKSFADRELMEELRSRGYKGVFKRVKIEEIKI